MAGFSLARALHTAYEYLHFRHLKYLVIGWCWGEWQGGCKGGFYTRDWLQGVETGTSMSTAMIDDDDDDDDDDDTF